MIRDQAVKEAAETAAKADEIVQRMLATKITRDEVAERLGIPVREVRRTTAKASATAAASAGDEDPSEKEASVSNDAQSADAA
jgi:DNA-directed RNA polymerase specialized sigma subunit